MYHHPIRWQTVTEEVNAKEMSQALLQLENRCHYKLNCSSYLTFLGLFSHLENGENIIITFSKGYVDKMGGYMEVLRMGLAHNKLSKMLVIIATLTYYPILTLLACTKKEQKESTDHLLRASLGCALLPSVLCH